MEKKFNKALVIFIDILGSKSRKEFNELYKINRVFHSVLRGNKKNDRDYTSYQRHIYTFSDCAYIIYDYKNHETNNIGGLINVAFLNSEVIFLKLLGQNIIFRGGASYGDVYYDKHKNLFFGAAINEAYRLESTEAKYPRIVLNDFIVNELLYNTIAEEPRSYISKDTDGKQFFNYFHSIRRGIDCSIIVNKTNQQLMDDIIALCDKNILQYENDQNIRSKYEWLKKITTDSICENTGLKMNWTNTQLLNQYIKELEAQDVKFVYNLLPNVMPTETNTTEEVILNGFTKKET